jgi:hypothetical protein
VACLYPGRPSDGDAPASPGSGKVLLHDALRRSVEQSWHITAMAVMVDAIDDAARNFYELDLGATLGEPTSERPRG